MISLSGENVQNTNPVYSYSLNAEKSEPHHINVYKEIVYFLQRSWWECKRSTKSHEGIISKWPLKTIKSPFSKSNSAKYLSSVCVLWNSSNTPPPHLWYSVWQQPPVLQQQLLLCTIQALWNIWDQSYFLILQIHYIVTMTISYLDTKCVHI